MTRRRLLVTFTLVLFMVTLGLVIRNQVRVYRNRQIRASETRLRHAMFDALRPVALKNCELERFGEPNDGGYLMCANLLGAVSAGYSYGISGYDQWGCDISTRLKVRLHQYDCFNLTRPSCPGGDTVFHEECVAGNATTDEGRVFDTIRNQFDKNGDRSKHIVLKIDVEGAEWESFRRAPDDVFAQIDQMAVEFHWTTNEKQDWVQDERHLQVIERLKTFFHIAHVHFNNAGCIAGLDPFPSLAYEVLFVSKRLGVVDLSRTVGGLHPLDALNDPKLPDCQPAAR